MIEDKLANIRHLLNKALHEKGKVKRKYTVDTMKLALDFMEVCIRDALDILEDMKIKICEKCGKPKIRSSEDEQICECDFVGKRTKEQENKINFVTGKGK